MAKKCARTFSIVVEKGKKSILEVRHLLPDALPRSVCMSLPTINADLARAGQFYRPRSLVQNTAAFMQYAPYRTAVDRALYVL